MILKLGKELLLLLFYINKWYKNDIKEGSNNDYYVLCKYRYFLKIKYLIFELKNRFKNIFIMVK